MTDLAKTLTNSAAAEVNKLLQDETGGCHCDRAFSERGRVDPDCSYCCVGGEWFGAEAGRAAVAAVLETLAEHCDPVSIGPESTEQALLTNSDLRRLSAEVRGVGEKP